MIITMTYQVNMSQYISATHNISLATTEYEHGNELLVHIQTGKDLNRRLNTQLADVTSSGGTYINSEQYLFKKTYNNDGFKLITRSGVRMYAQRISRTFT